MGSVIVERATSHQMVGVLADMIAIRDALTMTEWKILTCLLTRPGSTAREVVDEIYGDREDGGPTAATDVFRMHARNMRPKLKPFGYTVKSSGWMWRVVKLRDAGLDLPTAVDH